MSGGGSSGGFESYLPIATALAATVMTDGAASPALVEAMGSEAAAGAVVGGGVGALTGGGVAALTGQNVGQNALMGGLGGATLGYGMAPGDVVPGVSSDAGIAGVANANGATLTSAADPLSNMYNAGALSGGAGNTTGLAATGAGAGLFGTGITGTQAAMGLGGIGLLKAMNQDQSKYGVPPTSAVTYKGGNLQKFNYDPANYKPDVVTPPNPTYQANYAGYPGYADGGLLQSGPANVDYMGGDMYPQSQQRTSAYATPSQIPTSAQATASLYEPKTNPLTGEEVSQMAAGGVVAFDGGGQAQASFDPYAELQAQAMYSRLSGLPQLVPTSSAAGGKIQSLGSYSDGGQMLKGPGDGMSDSIPATIQGKQPARLADNEFVVPADVVSHLGNGSSDAGAKKLYAMMDKVRKARTGKAKQAPEIKAGKYMPA
jgi:hypothetical protein